MPINNVVQFDETDSGNVDISGIGLSDATLIDQLDNIARAQMGALARFTGADTIASATTTDLGTLAGQYVEITGTTTITGLGTIRAGIIKFIRFAGALTLTYNATSLILPGAANILTVAGDTAVFVSEGSGNWRCIDYSRASGEALVVAATGGNSNAPQNLSLVASVASNALTIAIKGHDGNDPSATNPVYIPFRSATAGSGDVDVLTLTAATSLVVSSGSTLGTTSAVAAALVLVGFNDGGTFRLGVVNPQSGIQIVDGVASSTAEGGAGAADSAGVFYTGTAVTSKPYTVLGALSATQATAGTWATAPSAVSVGNDAQVSVAKVAASLPVFACRAWVDFDGSSGAVRASGNISSVTKNGTGDYTLNFATAMPDANYVLSGMATGANSGNLQTVINFVVVSPGAAPLLKSTTQCRFATANASGGSLTDFATVGIMVVR